MRESFPSTAASRVRDQIVVSTVLGVIATTAVLLGRMPLSVLITVLALLAYVDLRGLLGDRGHVTTFALGAGGVGAILWCGYAGELDMLPAVFGALVLLLLVTRVALNEAGKQTSGVTADLAATLGAVGVIGVLGAHILLLRAMPRVGFRGVLALGLMVSTNAVMAFFIGRWKGRHVLNKLVAPHKTWEGTIGGFVASVGAGVLVGLTMDPPFDLVSGISFGVGVGVLTPLGDLCFSAIKRSAGVKNSGTYLRGAGGALDVVDTLFFAAPAYYWAFRTIAL